MLYGGLVRGVCFIMLCARFSVVHNNDTSIISFRNNNNEKCFCAKHSGVFSIVKFSKEIPISSKKNMKIQAVERITIPDKVTVACKGRKVTVKGPRGALTKAREDRRQADPRSGT